MLVGYARISTYEQNLDLQLDALKNAGCGQFFKDIVSGTKDEREGLFQALQYVRSGDTLVVWRLDRLGRSLSHLIETIRELANRGVGFRSLTENIDTTTSGGKLVFHFFGALAEFERDLIRERTLAGLQAARARGRRGGNRRSPLDDPRTRAQAQLLFNDKNNAILDICKTFGVSRATLYRYVDTKKRPMGRPKELPDSKDVIS
jgi:DNA invertase Pin-like site-specific DNA recombinase